MKIKNITRGTVLAEKGFICRTLKSRLVGLLNRSSLDTGDSLVLTRCNSIHTFFMRFAIDALFLDSQGRVVGKLEALAPFRISPVFWQAQQVIELPAGTLKNTATQISDIIRIEA
jgi:uncharacterized protein